jgi:signal transduction histidine kinase
MGEMISMIAHQWRQPISAIAMGANNILADIELEILDNETLKDGAISILNQTQELSKTIDDFRNFFKPSKTLEEVLIKDIFTEAYEIIGSSFKNNNVEVITEIENRLKIKTYPRELMQVLLNILKNAKEALAYNEVPQKRIYVSMKDELSNAVIKICDNAKGIKEELLQRIFEPYFSTKDEKNGTGLGLYMSKTIIEKHLQGSLKVYNKDDGVCFEIKLPYVMQEKIE